MSFSLKIVSRIYIHIYTHIYMLCGLYYIVKEHTKAEMVQMTQQSVYHSICSLSPFSLLGIAKWSVSNSLCSCQYLQAYKQAGKISRRQMTASLRGLL